MDVDDCLFLLISPSSPSPLLIPSCLPCLQFRFDLVPF